MRCSQSRVGVGVRVRGFKMRWSQARVGFGVRLRGFAKLLIYFKDR